MAYPNKQNLTVQNLFTSSPSFGTSPISAYIRAPFRCQILKFEVLLSDNAPLSGAASFFPQLNGVAVAGSTMALTTTTSTATLSQGALFESPAPTSATFAQEGDIIGFVSSGGTATSLQATLAVVVRAV